MGALLVRSVAAQRTGQPASRGGSLDYLARLVRAFDADHGLSQPGRGAAAAVPGLVEQLTARELEVLQLLAAVRTGASRPSSCSASMPSKGTSAASWTSSARPTATRPSPRPSWA